MAVNLIPPERHKVRIQEQKLKALTSSTDTFLRGSQILNMNTPLCRLQVGISVSEVNGFVGSGERERGMKTIRQKQPELAGVELER